LAEALARAPRLSPERVLLVNLSGRGDKDLESVHAFDAAHRKGGA
jgi:tryptophan synthase beta subunit